MFLDRFRYAHTDTHYICCHTDRHTETLNPIIHGSQQCYNINPRREGNGCRPDYLLTATSVTLVSSVAKQISRPLPSDPHNITADQWINRHVSLLQGLFWDWEWASEEHSSSLPSYWSESLCLDGERMHLIYELCGQHVSAAALGLVHVLKPRVCTTIDHCNLYWC